MGTHCNICRNNLDHGPQSVVLCRYKKSFVHLGCCVDNCSMHKAPCEHAIGTYDKLG